MDSPVSETPPHATWTDWSRLERAPVLLQAYLAFAVIATVLHMSSAFVPQLGRVVMPYTGSGLMYYMFTLFFATFALISTQRKAIYGVLLMLALAVFLEGLRAFHYIYGPDSGRVDYNNPYLSYDVYRPALTVALPLTWMLLLVSPGVRRWTNTAADDDSRRGQFTITDLLFVMAALSIGLATSVGLVRLTEKAKQSTPPATSPLTAPPTPSGS